MLTKKDLYYYDYDVINANDNTTIDALQKIGLIQKIGYNSGVYGWNWSAYICKNNLDIVFIEGYRHFPKTNGKIKNDITEQLHNFKDLYYNQKLSYYEYLDKIKELFKDKTDLNNLIEA